MTSEISTAPVTIALEILQLAKTAFPPSRDAANLGPDPLTLYHAKFQMQHLCDKLLQHVLGRREYTVLLAGETGVISAVFSNGADGCRRIMP